MARIVVIADCDASKGALDVAIRARGHDTLSTTDPLLGLELAVTTSPDAVVVDHDGPCMDELTLVRELHEVLQEECPAILVIVAATDHDERWSELPEGVAPCAVLPRHYDDTSVVDAIARMLETGAPPGACSNMVFAVRQAHRERGSLRCP